MCIILHSGSGHLTLGAGAGVSITSHLARTRGTWHHLQHSHLTAKVSKTNQKHEIGEKECGAVCQLNNLGMAVSKVLPVMMVGGWGSTAEGKSGVARDVDTDHNKLYSLGIVGPDSYCHNYWINLSAS